MDQQKPVQKKGSTRADAKTGCIEWYCPKALLSVKAGIQHLQSRHVGAGKTRPDNPPAKSRSPKIVGKKGKARGTDRGCQAAPDKNTFGID